MLEAKAIADNLYEDIGDQSQHWKMQSKQLQERLERIGGLGVYICYNFITML